MSIVDVLAGHLGPPRRESEIHPHHPAERAELYAAFDAGSSEVETVELLWAVARWLKPDRILETGGYVGVGSATLARACQANGRGVVHVCERDAAAGDRVRALVGAVGAADFLRLEPGESTAFLGGWAGGPFGMAFLDSDFPARGRELELLLDRRLLAPRAVVLVHDTSPLRSGHHGDNGGMNAALDRLGGRMAGEFRLPYSRGLRLFQFGD